MEKYSGFNSNGKVKGLAFAGEQTIPGASGNSIVVLYNQASNLALNYRIVKHGTQTEMPVILSFISTDIDAAQGVETNLANITQIVPDDSGLKIKDNIIYDATPGIVGYNGSKDLPRGGYLGAGFLSSFDYVFYSPAPARVNNSYAYPIAVRYDIFGSSLQANILTQVSQHIQVQYVDRKGVELKPSEHYEGFTDKKYDIDAINIENYQLINAESDLSNPLHPVIKFIYTPEYVYKLHFVDNNGKQLLDSKKYTVLDGDTIEYTPENIDGYKTPDSYKTVVNNNGEYKFVYTKVKPKTVADTKSIETNKTNKQKSTVKRKKGARIISSSNNKVYYPKQHSRSEIKNDKDKYTKTKPKSVISKKSEKDWFLVNTGMNAEQKKRFLNYIDGVALNPQKGFTVNHAVANAIGYPIYKDDPKQWAANDIGKKPEGINSDIEKILNNARAENGSILIDFPHLAMPLASAERSGFFRESLKFIMGLSPGIFNGEHPRDVFFQHNTFTGDYLTIMTDKDKIADMDAYILYYHPDFKNIPLNERIKKYYSTPDLGEKRKNYFDQALQTRSREETSGEYKDKIFTNSIYSLGGIGLVLYGGYLALRNFAQRRKDNRKPQKQKNVKPRKHIITNYVKNKATGIYNKIIKPQVSKVWNKAKLYYKKYAKPVYNIAIKPVLKSFKKYVIRPIKKYVVSPVKNFLKRKISQVKRRYRRVKQVYRKRVKPAVKRFIKKHIRPKYNKYVRPYVNRYIRPVYRRYVKPVARFVKNRIYRPAKRFVKNKIFKPIKNWFTKWF